MRDYVVSVLVISRVSGGGGGGGGGVCVGGVCVCVCERETTSSEIIRNEANIRLI